MLPLATRYHTHYHFHPFHFKFKDLVAKQHPTSYNVQLPIVQAVKMIWRVSNKPLTIKCPPSSQAHQATGILDWRLERLYTSLFSSRILAIPKSLSLIWRSKVNHEGHMKPQEHMCIYIYTHTVFLRSDAAATIYFTAHFVRLLFEGGVYFFGKPGNINEGWIR